MIIYTELLLILVFPIGLYSIITLVSTIASSDLQPVTQTAPGSPLQIENNTQLKTTSENTKIVIKGTKQEGGVEGIVEGLIELAFPPNVDFIPDPGESLSRLYTGLIEQPLQQFGQYLLEGRSSPNPLGQASTTSSPQSTQQNAGAAGGASNSPAVSNTQSISNRPAISNAPTISNTNGNGNGNHNTVNRVNGNSNVQGNSNNVNGNSNSPGNSNNVNGNSNSPGNSNNVNANSNSQVNGNYNNLNPINGNSNSPGNYNNVNRVNGNSNSPGNYNNVNRLNSNSQGNYNNVNRVNSNSQGNYNNGNRVNGNSNIQGNSNNVNRVNTNYKTQTSVNNSPTRGNSPAIASNKQKVKDSNSNTLGNSPTASKSSIGFRKENSKGAGSTGFESNNEDYDSGSAQEATRRPGIYYLRVSDTPPIIKGQGNSQPWLINSQSVPHASGTEDDEGEIEIPIAGASKKPPGTLYKIYNKNQVPNLPQNFESPSAPEQAPAQTFESPAPPPPPEQTFKSPIVAPAPPNLNEFANPPRVSSNQGLIKIPENAQVQTIYTNGLPSAIGATGNVQIFVDQSGTDLPPTTVIPLGSTISTTEDDDDDDAEEEGENLVAKS